MTERRVKKMKAKLEAEIERTTFGDFRIRLIGNDQALPLLDGLRLNASNFFIVEKVNEKEVVLKSCSAGEVMKTLTGKL